MNNLSDYIGKTIGRRTILEVEEINSKLTFKVKCECGNIFKCGRYFLKKGKNNVKCNECKAGKSRLPLDNYINMKFGNRIVKGITKYQGKTYFICECICGKTKNIPTHMLLNNKRTDCQGCTRLKHNLEGQNFGDWKVIERCKGDMQKYLCQCKCGTQKKIKVSDILKHKTESCIKCSEGKRGANNVKYTGYGEITGLYFAATKCGAKSRNLNFNITIEEIWNLFLSQNRLCNYTGLLLNMKSSKKKGDASLDRIDSNIGYEKNNIQWVHKTINKMKQNLPEKDFIYFCKLVADYSNKKQKLYTIESNQFENLEWAKWI